MKNVSFYLPKDSMNEATDYYVALLESCFKEKEYNTQRYAKYQYIPKGSSVVTIRPGDQAKLSKKNNSFFINWFQGIGPEEYIMLHGRGIKSYFISKYLNFLEKKALSQSDVCVFVSEKMKIHYEKKYGLSLDKKSVIIPCYNKLINQNYFNNTERYDNLNFVYAGGLFSWQCIEETLLIFKEVYELDNTATLTLLTGQQEEAKRLINKFNLSNVSVDFVHLDDLQERLATYKYGFLVRENNPVNNVSTPTKMNSYLAAGLIPIYTDVIDAFERNINLEHCVRLELPLDYKKIASRIIEHHRLNIDKKSLFDDYNNLFRTYYNDEVNKNKFKKAIL